MKNDINVSRVNRHENVFGGTPGATAYNFWGHFFGNLSSRCSWADAGAVLHLCLAPCAGVCAKPSPRSHRAGFCEVAIG